MTIKKKVLADGSRICRPRKYANHDQLPDTLDAKNVMVALQMCQLEESAPEYGPDLPNLTGRYSGDGAAVCLNQAGFHIEMWWSSILGGNDGGNRTVYRYSGDLSTDRKRFVLRPAKVATSAGALTFANFATTKSILLEFDDGSRYDVVRFSERATWSDRVLDVWRSRGLESYHPVVRGILEDEHAPIVPWQVKKLERVLKGKSITKHLEALFGLDLDEDRAAIIERLKALHHFYVDEGYTGDKSPFAPADRERIKAHARHILHSSKLTLMSAKGAQEELTLYEWFQRVLHYDVVVKSGWTPPFKTWFGVKPSQPFRYKLWLQGYGYAIKIGIPIGEKFLKKLDDLGKKLPDGYGKDYLRKMVINKVKGLISASAGFKRLTGVIIVESEQPGGWIRTYPFDMAFAAGGRGGGGFKWNKMISATGWCETPVEWLPQDFPGDLTVFSGLLATWEGKRTDDQFVLNARGSGTDKGTQLIFDDVQSKFGSDALGLGWGEIVAEKDEISPPNDKARFKTIKYEEDTATGQDVAFVLGSATLRKEGRKKLRVLAANELAEFRDRSSRLCVYGFADRIDRRWFNKALSNTRADNTTQALKDCLGSDFVATVHAKGFGEEALRFLDYFLDFPDEAAQPEWRRSFAILNAHSMVSLEVRDLKDVKK